MRGFLLPRGCSPIPSQGLEDLPFARNERRATYGPSRTRSESPTLTTIKSLAIPAHRKRPGFDEVAPIALMGATICGQQFKS
jgi:hypothetical protein